MKIGEVIRVMEHSIEGLRWTVGQVGYIKSPAHVSDFNANYPGGHIKIPLVKERMWLVSLDHDKAKNGYAHATLPEELLPPHACTDRCKVHKGLLG